MLIKNILTKITTSKVSKSNLFFSFLVTLLILIILEIGMRIFVPISDPYEAVKINQNRFINSEYPPNFYLETITESDLPGMDSKVRKFTTNNFGFRGDDMDLVKPKDEYRIFVIGGSTTEDLYLDDSETWTKILQNTLNKLNTTNKKIKVYSAGKSGDRSDNHISMLVHRIIHMEPSMVIVFSGVNDLRSFFYDHDYLHFYPKQKISTFTVFRVFATEFQIPRYLYRVAENFIPNKDKKDLEEITLKSNFREKANFIKKLPAHEGKLKPNNGAYALNLKTLAGISKSHDFTMVFMTQASSWNSQVDPTIKQWHWRKDSKGKLYRESELDEALEIENDAMRSVAQSFSIPLYDLASILPKSSEYFYDDFHFNVNGAKSVGEDLAKFIFNKRLITN